MKNRTESRKNRGLRQDLSDREYRIWKQIWKKISNIYYKEDSDPHHNSFVSVIIEIAKIYNNNGWTGIFYKIKQRNNKMWIEFSNLYSEEKSDIYHRIFVSIIKEITEVHNNNGWIGIYNIIKHRKGRI